MRKKRALSRKLLQKVEPFLPQIEERWPGTAWMGWGRRPYAIWAARVARLTRQPFLTLEDGWIRSRGLGDDPVSYSLIVDDLGIYYDATTPSRLERILKEYDFSSDRRLMEEAVEGLETIRRTRIAKYNHAPMLRPSEARKIFGRSGKCRVMIVAQTAGDASLCYGWATEPTLEMIERARRLHPDAEIYLKIHPDVLAGIKGSDIRPEGIPSWCRVVTEDRNPYSLLEYVDVVHTKTSGMGMEALIAGKEVYCSGLPWYAGWGMTRDRLSCSRRQRLLSLEELFAAAYLLYPIYADPRDGKILTLQETIRSLQRP